MQIITKVAELKSLIADVVASHKDIEGKIHVALVGCLYQVNKHHNTTPLSELMSGLGGSVRKNAMRDWCLNFGKLSYNEQTKELEFDKSATPNGTLEEGMAKPFWDFKPEAAFKAFDLKAQIANLIKQAEKAAKRSDERDSIDGKMLIGLRELASNIGGNDKASNDSNKGSDPLELEA